MTINQCETTGGYAAGSLSAAPWLSLAATPTFAVMAFLSSFGGDATDVLCAATHGPFPLTGMVPMYLLMSIFHAAPWLRLMSGERRAARQS
jgi:hypothetical protein